MATLEPWPSSIQPSDAAGLGPPPRELAPNHLAYIKRMKPSLTALYIILAVLFGGVGAIVFAVFPSMQTFPWIGAFLIGLAIYTQRETKAIRAKLRDVLQHGDLRLAYVEDIRQMTYGRRTIFGQKYRYTVRFDVDGKKVTLVTLDDGVSLLPIGTQVEVVWFAKHPSEIAPAFLLM